MMNLHLSSDRRSVTLFTLLILLFIRESFTFNGKRFHSRPSVSSYITSRLGPLSAQSLDYTSLYLSVQELAKVSVPGKVENIIQENEYNIFFGIKTVTGNNVWLQFCWHPSAARIGLGYAPPRGETIPYSFAATLRALLRGYSVTKIHISMAFDRIAEVEFSERLSDEKPKWRLILEVMGARSNAILVSHDDNVIQACAYQVSSSTTVRPLQTGGTYYQPPSGGGIFSPSYKEGIDSKDFLSIFTARLQELDVTVEKSLVSCYRGMSPNIARRILDASNVDGLSMVKTLNSQDILSIFRHFCSWASIFDSSMIQRMHGLEYSVPSVITNPGMAEFGIKKGQEFYPITFSTDKIIAASTQNEVEGQVVIDVGSVENVENRIESTGINTSLKVSKFLLSFYSLYERKAAFQLLRASCEKKVSLRIKKAGKVLADFQEQEKDAKGEKCEDLKALGDLVTSFTHSYKEKSQVLQCYDFITGEPKIIQIPVGVTPSDYAKSAYMKAKKLKRSLKVLENLIAKVTLHVDYLSEIEASISGLMDYISYEDITTLSEIEEELEDLDQLTIIQLGDFSSTGEVPATAEKLTAKEKDKKKSKSKLKSGKQTKSTAKPAPTAKKGSTNTAPTSQKKALQGLLVLRPASTQGNRNSNSNSNSNSSSRSSSDAEASKRSSKSDRSDAEDGISTPLPSLIVGRSSKQNDRITFEIAKEHHLWFHVQGVPGSHVLLQLEPGDQPSPEGIQYAADVASFYSKARGGTKVPVGYCSPKHIRRITGGSPGMVSIMQQGGMVYGSPEKGKMWVEKYGPQTIDSYK